MAVTSLVLAILACFPFSIAGLILGIIALRKINRSRGELTGRGLAIGGIAVSAVFLGLQLLLLPAQFAILLPSLSRARGLAKATVCSANMSSLGKALFVYANQNGDACRRPIVGATC